LIAPDATAEARALFCGEEEFASADDRLPLPDPRDVGLAFRSISGRLSRGRRATTAVVDDLKLTVVTKTPADGPGARRT